MLMATGARPRAKVTSVNGQLRKVTANTRIADMTAEHAECQP